MPTNGTNITSIVKSDVGQTTGPDWATNLNTSLDAIDDHDHSTGKGTKVTPAGMNVNADLEMNGNNLTEVRALQMQNSTDTTTSDTRSLYSESGNLYYRNGTGAAIRITAGTAIDVSATGAISNLTSPATASFSSISNAFTWSYDGTNPAKMVQSDTQIYKYGEATNNSIIKHVATSGSNTLNLPDANNKTLLANECSVADDINLTVTGANNINLTVASGQTVTVTIGSQTAVFADTGSEMVLTLS